MIIQEYLKYTQESESPESYHIWVFLSMVSAVVGKKAWINCSYFKVYPNQYIILVSLPGVGKKSTAIRIGRGIIQDSECECKFTSDSTTPQALMIDLNENYHTFEYSPGKFYGQSPLTSIASELVSLLSSGPSMVEFLTDIYDSDKLFQYKTKNMGSLEIKNPCLNIIAGVTTDTFCSRIIKDAVAGGFISRSIIIYDNETRINSPFSMPSEEQLNAREKVVQRFKDIAKLYGEVSFTPEAKDYYETWYVEEMKQMKAKTTNLEFHSRKHVHVLKTAMLLALSELKLVIDITIIKAAIELLKRVEHNMKFVYMSAGANKHAEFHIKILSALNAVEEIEYGEILQHFMKDVEQEEFDKILSTLDTIGYIQVTATPKGGRMLKITAKGKSTFDRYA